MQRSMLEAGREEKEIAIKEGTFHHGVPAITLTVDAGWSKRSHKYSYNAKSEEGIINGEKTGRIGVRNKYCTACAQGTPPSEHQC